MSMHGELLVMSRPRMMEIAKRIKQNKLPPVERQQLTQEFIEFLYNQGPTEFKRIAALVLTKGKQTDGSTELFAATVYKLIEGMAPAPQHAALSNFANALGALDVSAGASLHTISFLSQLVTVFPCELQLGEGAMNATEIKIMTTASWIRVEPR